MPLFFSKRPGCHESHVRRKYENPLFRDDLGRIDQNMVNEARTRDESELNTFHNDLRRVLERAANLEPETDSDTVLSLKEDIEKLYETSAGLAGNLEESRAGLERLLNTIMQTILKHVGNDTLAMAELHQEGAARAMHHELLNYPLVAHLLRPDSPIAPEELVPTLLSEESDSIQAVMRAIDHEQKASLCIEAEKLLDILEKQGYTLPKAIAAQACMREQLHKHP